MKWSYCRFTRTKQLGGIFKQAALHHCQASTMYPSVELFFEVLADQQLGELVDCLVGVFLQSIQELLDS
mgnify:FL=1|jgi:hypothetical protein